MYSCSVLDPFTGTLCVAYKTLTYKRAEVKKVLTKGRGPQIYAGAWRTYRLDSDDPQEVLRVVAERAGKWYLRRREVAARQTRPWPLL